MNLNFDSRRQFFNLWKMDKIFFYFTSYHFVIRYFAIRGKLSVKSSKKCNIKIFQFGPFALGTCCSEKQIQNSSAFGPYSLFYLYINDHYWLYKKWCYTFIRTTIFIRLKKKKKNVYLVYFCTPKGHILVKKTIGTGTYK